MRINPGISYQQLRQIYSKTGVWKKKITRTALSDIENHWKEAVLSPSSANIVRTADENAPPTKYILSMFPYPSGDLHMGHMRVYTISDVLARYHRLNGSQVLHPIGWDAFGLPAENAAIDRKIAPRQWTESNISRMKKQLRQLRISFDWEREITTCNPDYYKWTQLLFLRMYNKGLAYSMKASVNWDPVDQTVLADEQIDSQGNSWRSGAKATKKDLTQWYLKATNYTQSLLDGLDSLDPDSCRGFANAQRTWMNRPTGVRINVKIQPSNETLSVFTESPELLYGVQFLQINSDHPLVTLSSQPITAGVLEGQSMIHPLTGDSVPIVVMDSDSLPTGGVNNCRLGIPTLYGGDEETALMYNVALRPKVLDSESKLKNSPMFDGMSRVEARAVCNLYLQERKLGGWSTSAELRDWLISRQRYWGTPIPIVHCTSCGDVPVPEDQLPVVLPDIQEINLKSGNPLLSQQEWINTPCPSCGKASKRETDTMDTFVDSAWYYLRFTDPHNHREPFSKELVDAQMPVDVYVGGAEHAILHMYYARFFNHFLYDEGMIKHREPFSLQLALGTVHSDCYKLTSSGKYLHRSKVSHKEDVVVEKGTGEPVTHTLEKMSKSKLNGVNPNDVLTMHGVDQTRLYMLANAAPRAVKNWNPELAKKLLFPHGKQLSIPKWMHILWHTVTIIRQRRLQLTDLTDTETSKETIDMLYSARNSCVSTVTLHLEHTFNLHEAIHSLYDILHVIDKEAPLNTKVLSPMFEKCFTDMLVLLHPFAPHITAELWEGLRTAEQLPVDDESPYDKEKNILNQRWPTVDDDFPLPLIIQHAKDPSTSQSEHESLSISQSDDIEYSQSTEEDAADSNVHEPPSHNYHRSMLLPAKMYSSMTSDQALTLALESNLIELGVDSSMESATKNCKLVLRPNCGAVLTLCDSVELIRLHRQEVSSEHVHTNEQKMAS